MTEKHQRLLDYLRNLHKHLDRMSYQEVCIDLDAFNQSLPSLILDTDKIRRFEETHPRDASIIYRARENETIIPKKGSVKFPFKTVSEISLIPECKKDKIKFGRCNKPFESRFYSSNDLRAATMECLTKGFTKDISENEFVTVGRWKIIEPLTLAQVNYSQSSLNEFLQHDKERYEKMLEYSKGFNEHAAKLIAEGGQHDVEFSKQALEIFSDEFAKIDIKEGYDYTISNYYCDNIFDKTNNYNPSELIDGILYPSVSFAYQEMNLVLHPRAMKKIKFLDASLVWVVHHGQSGNIEFAPLEQNVKADSDGNLLWKKFNWTNEDTY